MSSSWNAHSCAIVFAMALTGLAQATLPPEEAADLMATRLDQEQLKEGLDQGVWVSEELFVGPVASGMACASEWTGNLAYRASAELAGDYILWRGASVGNLMGDEAYALMRLSEMSDKPEESLWRTTLVDFYESPRLEPTEGTTDEYIAFFDEVDPSTAVFYLAHHAITANYVDDLDKDRWRSAVIRYLSRVDDDSSFPVTALGAATWSLAATGPLDATPVARDYEACSCWEGVRLSDLPALLLTHQVPEDGFFGGSFYWRFDHSAGETNGVVAGYTEDTVFGVLGLIATAAQDSLLGEETDAAVEAAQRTLLEGIDEDGRVYAHLARQGQVYHAFAGEMLQALWGIAQYQSRRESPDPNAVALSQEP